MKTEFILSKNFSFEAAHRLDHHDGKCARLHGHSFKLTVVVAGADIQPVKFNTEKGSHEAGFVEFNNPKANMLLDYGVISDIVKPFVEEKLDHHFLNETLETDSPTSEFIARYCFDCFSEKLQKYSGVELREIRISETCTSEAIYRKV